MDKITVIPSRRWEHTNGATASIYGACPWTNDADAPNWKIVTVGWTWQHPNGTVGLGRVPAKTREEAQALADRINTRRAG